MAIELGCVLKFRKKEVRCGRRAKGGPNDRRRNEKRMECPE
jgi:hypothetical protein